MKKIYSLINFLLKFFNFKLIKIVDQFSNSYRLCLAFKEKKINFIFDIGANEGQFAKELRFYGYRETIYSFEPLLESYEKLLKNSLNDENWKVHRPVALGNKNTKNFINISKNLVSSSILKINKEHLDNAPESNVVGKQQIEETRFEDIFQNLNL